jgi:hypothetical protein
MGRARPRHGRRDPARAVNVVIFYQEHVAERKTMVDAAAHPHGVLIQHAIAGERFAGVQDRRPGGSHGIHEGAGVGSDTRHPLQEIERATLRRQQRGRRPLHLGDLLTCHHFLAVSDAGHEHDGGIHAVEHRFGHRQAGDHARGLSRDEPVQQRAGVQRRLAGRIARADVLGNG